MRIKCPVLFGDTAIGPATGTVNTVEPRICACPFMNYQTASSASGGPQSLLGSEVYRRYCSLYEEVKCIGMKVRVAVMNVIGGADVPSLEIITAFDRKVCRDDMVNPPTFEELKSYSSAKVYVATSNSMGKFSRSVYASDLMEKSVWHDCSLTASSSAIQDNVWYGTGLGVSPSVGFFSPGMWIAFRSPTTTSQLTVRFQLDISYYVSLRNPKFGSVPALTGAKSVEEPVMRASAPEFEVEDLDLADDEDVQADIIAQELAAKRASVKKTATKIVTPKK